MLEVGISTRPRGSELVSPDSGFAILDNHLHLLVRLDPDVAAGWSDEEVVRHWERLFPPRDKTWRALPVSGAWGWQKGQP